MLKLYVDLIILATHKFKLNFNISDVRKICYDNPVNFVCNLINVIKQMCFLSLEKKDTMIRILERYKVLNFLNCFFTMISADCPVLL